MAPKLLLVYLLLITSIFMRLAATINVDNGEEGGGLGGSWCVARSDASNQLSTTDSLGLCMHVELELELIVFLYIQSNGLCYIPNTLQAHASYAFNSFYQRKARAPASSHFAATSTIAQTDPSYGSCVYPSSVSWRDKYINLTTSPNVTTPSTTTTPVYGEGDAGGLTPGMIPPIPDNSRALQRQQPSQF